MRMIVQIIAAPPMLAATTAMIVIVVLEIDLEVAPVVVADSVAELSALLRVLVNVWVG